MYRDVFPTTRTERVFFREEILFKGYFVEPCILFVRIGSFLDIRDAEFSLNRFRLVMRVILHLLVETDAADPSRGEKIATGRT